MKRLFTNTCVLACFAVALTSTQQLHAQIVQQAVGGVSIDADGIVSAPTTDQTAQLERLRRQALAPAPAELQGFTPLRAVSLKQLEATVADHLARGTELPDEVKYLAGLQRAQFVFVYPEQGDVVIAGPAEGWRVDALGTVVGETTGRPVLLLDDLIVALRTRQVEQLEAISCSIDPTPEGMQRYRALMSRQRTIGDPDSTMTAMEEALGPQKITVTGVPVTSHFARTLVAADFRMKRLAMNFVDAPVDQMPSFLTMLKSTRANASMTPRWWLAANYQPIARDAAGLAWEIRGQGVRCMTEADHFNAAGERVDSGKASPAATQWAENFTARYEELADHDSAFASLRNAMDLAVVAALVDRNRLLDQTGLDLSSLTHAVALAEYPAPQQVASQASFVRRRGDYLISTSGGVELLPWELVERTETIDAVSAKRAALAAPSGQWTWQ